MEVRITIVGTTPLLMHSTRLADPLDPIVKEIKRYTSKRVNKTDEDQEKIAQLEFTGSLYLDAEIGPYIPGDNIQRCLTDAARMNKLGVKVTRGLFVSTNVNPLAYDGPRTAEALWANPVFRHRASVKVTTSRTMRTRPIFHKWSTEALATVDTGQLSLEDIKQIAENAGSFIGLCDWRPRFGRFTATVEQA